MQWIIYTTLGCHLCSDAYLYLHNALVKASDLGLSTANVAIKEVDVLSDDQLMVFAEKIPVIASPWADKLYYPFSKSEVEDFVFACLKANSSEHK